MNKKIITFLAPKTIMKLILFIAVNIFFVINGLAQNSLAKSNNYSVIKLDAYQEKQFSVKAIIGGKERTFLFDTSEGITIIK